MADESKFFALSDATRRLVFEKLAAQPMAVGELAKGMTVSRPAVSQHLRVLSDAGLVRVEAQGNRRLYSLEPEGLQELQRYLSQMWDLALSSFKEMAEKEDGE